MKKTLILTLLTILFAIDCNAQSLKDLLQQCNKASQQTASAYYESEIETSINQKKKIHTKSLFQTRQVQKPIGNVQLGTTIRLSNLPQTSL